jgi:hypothetical protein
MFKEEPVVGALIKGAATCSPKGPASVGNKGVCCAREHVLEPRRQDRSLYAFVEHFHHDF